MIHYTGDVSERQSLSEVKMGRGALQSVKECVNKSWNTLKTTFLDVKLQISSSTVHNIIKRFRETGKISVRKGQGRRPLLDARYLQALHWLV